MKDELLIELLEPFQIEKFKEGISELQGAELLRILSQIENEIEWIKRIINEHSSDPRQNDSYRISYSDLEGTEQTPLVQKIVNNLHGAKFNEIKKKIHSGEFSKIELFSFNNQLKSTYDYFTKTLLPLIETIKSEYILKQANDFKPKFPEIEPLKWDGLITQFAELLYEIKKKHEKKKILLNASYNEIAEHFVFWNDNEQA